MKLSKEQLYILNQTLQTDAVIEVNATGEAGVIISQYCNFFCRAFYLVELENTEEMLWKTEISWVANLNY
jgi:hypothetical protein